ncbi:unnamed protein product [Somion occarium]|uniref:Coiled-coil domain-containing protein 16 n=1 Tax=Somion occarium TaxID=3059160 RepID=A0ABP1E6U3_9APHY
MSDVRALLKAKRQEARVVHPLASYTSSGQLRCIACATIVKQAWNGHVGSKSHRTNVARLREEERARDAQAKRKASDEQEDQQDLKKARLESSPPPATGFPTDFFSDPTKAPPLQADIFEDDESAEHKQPDVIDLEWQQFQQAVLNPPETHETYERATIIAEPVPNPELPTGFPPLASAAEPAPEPELDEEALRRKREQDDREIIMDRLLEEERLQEEADAKVTMLKTRLDMIKKRREAAKAKRTS